MIIMIFAMDDAGVIGKNQVMPWHIPEDLHLFKNATMHHHVLMGRITYENLPVPLKGRIMHIASNQAKEGYINDIEAFISQFKEETLFVAGGGQIYQKCYPLCDELWISHVHGVHEGDTYFNLPYQQDFECIEEVEYNQFTFRKWRRIKKD
jgi:dihydrofolate reductase